MKSKPLSLAALAAAAFLSALPAHAQTEIIWWHSMGGQLGEWVNGLAKGFNDGQKDYKVTPVFKGTYPESYAAAIAAFRAGHAPHVLQVFEVGTANMMAAKGAIVPVGKVMTASVITVGPDRNAREAAQLMLDHRIGALPVVDGGRPIGIVTETDLLRAFVKGPHAAPPPRSS